MIMLIDLCISHCVCVLIVIRFNAVCTLAYTASLRVLAHTRKILKLKFRPAHFDVR